MDRRDTVTPGFKFNHWELRGVPLRIEVGPRDIQARSVTVVRRDSREKSQVHLSEVSVTLHEMLESVQSALWERALAFRAEHTEEVTSMDQLAERGSRPTPASSGSTGADPTNARTGSWITKRRSERSRLKRAIGRRTVFALTAASRRRAGCWCRSRTRGAYCGNRGAAR